MQQITSALLMATILAALGCQEQQQQPKGVSTADWPGWKGTTMIDPAGDLARLQGKWRRVPEEGAGEMWLTINGDIATYESFEFVGGGKAREPGEKPHINRYRFVLNSSLDPKVIRYVHRLGEGEPWPGHQAPLSRWYKLDGDNLTIWNHFMKHWTRPKPSFQRVKGEI